MKGLAFGIFAVLASSVNAFAADMPLKAAPLAPAYYDWSGAYLGMHAGYGGGMKDWSDQNGSAFDFPARGFLAGGQLGVNKQIASFVFGLELDGSWANISGSQSGFLGGSLIPTIQENFAGRSEIEGLVTLTGRAGLAADRWFVFAKGGLAGAWEKHSSTNSVVVLPSISVLNTLNGSEFRLAPVVGFGAEYALGGNWSIEAEYNYIHMGTRTVGLNGTATINVAGTVSTTPLNVDQSITQDSIHLVKVGANYRWGGSTVDPVYPPVRAVAGTNWTGAYIGAEAGYGFGRKEWPDFNEDVPPFGKYNVQGWLGGFDGGVNVQSGVFVFGVEGEWMWSGLSGGETSIAGQSLHTNIDWLAIASGRAGFVVGDRLLVYGKAGLAIANETHAIDQSSNGGTTSDANLKAVHSGIAVGVGAEYALPGNWSIKGEYNYVRMIGQNISGSEFVNVPGQGQVTLPTASNQVGQELNIFKIGVNYHFHQMPGVVSAKY